MICQWGPEMYMIGSLAASRSEQHAMRTTDSGELGTGCAFWHGIVDALAEAGITCWADKGYQGAGGTVRLPYHGRWDSLSAGQPAPFRVFGSQFARLLRDRVTPLPRGACRRRTREGTRDH
ncbi:hypothetical protein GCM10020367_12100 [Streptomyces sannanensis]|uniref:DDE Tnp4 domain-containing protein n=1 Tax=Streptomyces sannanensis TaxID=285536 RepID=A0ABP6S706_9ACTN